MTKFNPERRQWPRFVPRNSISVSIFGGGSQTFGFVADVSEAGARVVSDIRFRPGSQVLLRIGFDPQGEPFTTEGEIVWSRELTESKHVHGVKLRITEEEQRSRLRDILARPDFNPGELPGIDRQTAPNLAQAPD